jgi:hypothetical protein
MDCYILSISILLETKFGVRSILPCTLPEIMLMSTRYYLVASDGGGGLHWRDLRAPISDAKRWNIDRAKGERELSCLFPFRAILTVSIII